MWLSSQLLLPTPESRPTALQPHMVETTWFRLVPFRSPLLWESRLISFPPGTEMFHFPGSASSTLWIHVEIPEHDSWWVPPFRNPRVKGCLAPLRGLSQLTTSFFAVQRLGIRLLLLLTCSRRTSSFPCSIVNELTDSPSAAGLKLRFETVNIVTSSLGFQSARICRSTDASGKAEGVQTRKASFT